MQSLRLEYAGLRRDFNNLVKATNLLSSDTAIFVADRTGSIKFSRGIGKYGMVFPCLIKCVANGERINCLKALSKDMSGIYGCAFDKAQYIAVQVCGDGRTKCVIVDVSEADCIKARDYLQKLDNQKNYLERFAEDCVLFDLQNTVFELFEQKIAAITELINFSYCTYGKVEDIMPLDYRVMVDMLCKCAATYSCECIVHDFQNPEECNTMCKVAESYPKALLYAIAYLVKNSKNRIITIDYELSEYNVLVHFSTSYKESSHCALYMDILLKIMSGYEFKPVFHIENGYIKLTAKLRLVVGLQTVIREREEDINVIIGRSIFSDETGLAFRLVSGL